MQHCKPINWSNQSTIPQFFILSNQESVFFFVVVVVFVSALQKKNYAYCLVLSALPTKEAVLDQLPQRD